MWEGKKPKKTDQNELYSDTKVKITVTQQILKEATLSWSKRPIITLPLCRNCVKFHGSPPIYTVPNDIKPSATECKVRKILSKDPLSWTRSNPIPSKDIVPSLLSSSFANAWSYI